MVGEDSFQRIKNKIKDKNSWAKLAKIIRLKNSTHVFKIFFEDNNSVRKVMEIKSSPLT